MYLLRSTFLLLTAILALKASTDRWLRAYFLSQIVYALIGIAGGFNILSDRYAYLWTIRTLAVLVVSACYVFHRFRDESKPTKLAAAVECLMLPVFLTSLAVIGLADYLDRGLVLALGAGAGLLALGIGMATVANRKPVDRTLAALWLLLSGWHYAYGYGERYAERLFDGLNLWLPAAMVSAAFLAIYASSKVSPHSHPIA